MSNHLRSLSLSKAAYSLILHCTYAGMSFTKHKYNRGASTVPCRTMDLLIQIPSQGIVVSHMICLLGNHAVLHIKYHTSVNDLMYESKQYKCIYIQ